MQIALSFFYNTVFKNLVKELFPTFKSWSYPSFLTLLSMLQPAPH